MKHTPHNPHNPHNLTPEQIGVADGWRLMSKEEIESREGKNVLDQKFIEIWLKPNESWNDEGWKGNDPVFTYRTDRPLGYWMCNKEGEQIGDLCAYWEKEMEPAIAPRRMNETGVEHISDPRRFELIKSIAGGQDGLSDEIDIMKLDTVARNVIALADSILMKLNKESSP